MGRLNIQDDGLIIKKEALGPGIVIKMPLLLFDFISQHGTIFFLLVELLLSFFLLKRVLDSHIN